MEILKLNSWGWAVVRLQLRLGMWPRAYFDHATQAKVKEYQKAHGLKVDGEVGPDTRKALDLKPVSERTPIYPNKPWLTIARAEMGEREWPGKLVNSARIKEYHLLAKAYDSIDEVPWCGSFANWVMVESGREGPLKNAALAMNWLGWGDEIKEANRQPGDIVVVRKAKDEEAEKKDDKKSDKKTAQLRTAGYHVGFFIGKYANGIIILGGNQGPDGQASVNQAPYRINPTGYIVKGYRRPKSKGWNIFAKVGDTVGGVTQKGFEGWTKLATLEGGVIRNVSMETGNLSNREHTRPIIEPFSVTQYSDQSSPQLMAAMLRSKTMKVTIVMLSTDGREHIRYELTNAILSGLALSGHDEGTHTTAFMLSFSRLEVAHIPYDASGKPGSTLRVAYDVGAAKLA